MLFISNVNGFAYVNGTLALMLIIWWKFTKPI